ncbi:MAG: hypothetical protein IKB84_00145 [Clostridia bacterium]|nr:hypothetical protein [Clostridia bacterium]
MKKILIIILVLSLVLCGCNSTINGETADNESKTDESTNNNVEEGTKETDSSAETPIYDCLFVESEISALVEENLEQESNLYAERMLKVYRIGLLGFYRELSKKNIHELFESEGKHLDRYYYAENRSESQQDRLFCLTVDPMCDANNLSLEDRITIVDRNKIYPQWSLAYEYVLNPSIVFGEDVEIKNVYCLDAGERYTAALLKLDIIIYYETNKGDFILYRPYEYELINNSYSNYKKIGYSDTVYLFRPEILKDAWTYMKAFTDEEEFLNWNSYEGESRLREIVDLEPYKLVPGQLPE